MKKQVVFLLIAAILVGVGYVETQRNMLGLNDDAFMAYAGNTSNVAFADPATLLPPAAADTADTVIAGLFAVTDPGEVSANATVMPSGNATAEAGANVCWWGDASQQNNIDVAIQSGDMGGLSATIAAIWPGFGGVRGVTLPAAIESSLTGGTNGKVYPIVKTMQFIGLVGTTPANITPYKLLNSGQTATFGSFQATEPAVPAQGMWMVRDPGAGAFLAATDVMSDNTDYQIVLYVTNNGTWDLAAASGTILDPVIFGVGGGSAAGSSSSDSGCVYNPAAALSVEWLLLLIAPALLYFRRKK